ncbi:MAG: hypothetical protein P8098_08060 [Candidatus Thiodiazotropha sp.]
MTTEMVRQWVDRYGSDLHLGSACGQTADSILDDLEMRVERLHRISDLVYGEWLARVMSREVQR